MQNKTLFTHQCQLLTYITIYDIKIYDIKIKKPKSNWIWRTEHDLRKTRVITTARQQADIIFSDIIKFVKTANKKTYLDIYHHY